MAPLKYAALGSSFAAGPGIPPTVNRLAMRSANNYPNLLAEKLGAELTDLTVSGDTLMNIISEPKSHFFLVRFEPQIKNLPPDTDIVTITGGGNDLGYSAGIMRDVWNASFTGYVLSKLFLSAPSGLGSQDVADRFVAIIDEIRKIAPQARVVLVQYPTIFGSNTPIEGIPLDEDQLRHHRSVAESLEQSYQLAAAAREGVILVPVGELSREHGVGSQDPWVTGMNGAAQFHPNLNGMKATADFIYEKLKAENFILP